MLLSRKWLGVASVVGGLVLINCSAVPTGTFNSGGAGGDETGNWGQGGTGNTTAQGGNGGDGGSFIPPTGGGGNGPTDNCSDAAKLVYVLSDANRLYSFNPQAKQFTLIGPLNCNTSLQPNSMAVDRNAVAWVNYVGSLDLNGVIFKVNTKDASCEPTPVVNLPQGWTRMGMGFSTNNGDPNSETLFVSATSGQGVGKINAANTLNPIAGFSPGAFSGASAELTGTGDGRLYGYFTTSPVQVGQIDKTTGAVTNGKVITGLATPSAWAFSFWGGSFYLYAADFGNSNVTKYDPVAGTIDNSYMVDIGFRIVGAGVSTCAPLVEPPPK
jgi:hypothetical protein